MKKIFNLLFLLLLLNFYCFSIEGFASTPETLEFSHEIVSWARAYRLDTTLPTDIEKLRQKNILEKIFATLKKYDAHSSLENAVIEFLNDEISSNKEDYHVVNANLTDVGGASHDPVFLVRDVSGKLCYIVKAFRSPRDLLSKFVPEISSLALIQKLSIPGVVPIKPIAFAAYSNQDEEWGLLLETAAKGQRIDQFIYQLGSFQPTSKERKAFLEVCKKIFQKIGEVFAELHSRKSLQTFSIPEQDLAKYNNKISTILESSFISGELKKHFSMENFLQYVENIRDDALNTPLFYSYWHGDAHLGNMFYDTLKDDFYFIDVAKLHHSVSIQEEPLLDGTMDLVRVEENLRRRSIGILSESEVDAIIKSFFESYQQRSGQEIAQPVFLFDRTHKKLGRLVTYARYVEEDNSIKRSTDQAVFESAVEYFANQVLLEMKTNRS